eukprot:688918-Alexandrium_andersonii.AAC.1
MLWLTEHAAKLATKHLASHDDKNAFERLFGKEAHEDADEFGGAVYFKLKSTGADGRLSSRWGS